MPEMLMMMLLLPRFINFNSLDANLFVIDDVHDASEIFVFWMDFVWI